MSLRRRRVHPGLVSSCPPRFGQAASGRVPPLTPTANVMRYPPPDSSGIRAALFGSVSFLIENRTRCSALPLIGTAPQSKKKIYFLSGALSSSFRFLACFPLLGPQGVPPKVSSQFGVRCWWQTLHVFVAGKIWLYFPDQHRSSSPLGIRQS